jgi:hypothetical protein
MQSRFPIVPYALNTLQTAKGCGFTLTTPGGLELSFGAPHLGPDLNASSYYGAAVQVLIDGLLASAANLAGCADGGQA